MTDKLLIEALEREKFNAWLKGANYSPTGDEPGYRNDPAIRYPDQEETAWLGWMACARHRSQQEATQEPVAVGEVVSMAGGYAKAAVRLYPNANRLPSGAQLYATSLVPSESEALRPLPYGPNDIQWLKAIRGVLPKLLKVAEVEQQGADFVTVLGDLIARLETERAARAALSASGQKGESQ